MVFGLAFGGVLNPPNLCSCETPEFERSTTEFQQNPGQPPHLSPNTYCLPLVDPLVRLPLSVLHSPSPSLIISPPPPSSPTSTSPNLASPLYKSIISFGLPPPVDPSSTSPILVDRSSTSPILAIHRSLAAFSRSWPIAGQDPHLLYSRRSPLVHLPHPRRSLVHLPSPRQLVLHLLYSRHSWVFSRIYKSSWSIMGQQPYLSHLRRSSPLL